MLAYNETRSFQYFRELELAAKAALPKGSKLDPIDALRKFSLTKFADIIDIGEMAQELSALPGLTLYVPTNQAIDNLSEDESNLLQDASFCRQLVQMHTVPAHIVMYIDTEPVPNFDIDQTSLLPRVKVTHRFKPEPLIVASTKQPSACAMILYCFKIKNGEIYILDAVLGSSEERQYEILPWPAPGTVSPGDPRPFPEHDKLPKDFRLYGNPKEITIREAVG